MSTVTPRVTFVGVDVGTTRTVVGLTRAFHSRSQDK